MVCCVLGTILKNEERPVLFESDNFFVIPALGPIGIAGYLMIVSREHYLGVGGIPERHYRELQGVLDITRSAINKEYEKSPLVFEHGPKVCSFSGGGCLDHAHLHIVTGVSRLEELSIDLMGRLDFTRQYYCIERIEGFDRLAEIHDEGRASYTFVESPDLTRLVTEVNFRLPSQYLRQMIGKKTGNREWSWRHYPNMDLMNRTAERLKEKFR